MKHLLGAFFGIVLSFSAIAQQGATDTLTYTLKETSAAIREKTGGSHDRIVVEFTFDNWIHDEKDLKVKWYSRGFNTYFMYDIQLGKRKVISAAPGLGFGTSSIFTNSAMVEDSTGTQLVKRTDDYKKNKIGLAYFDIPVELRFRSKPNAKNKSWKVAAGFKAGVLMDGKTKLKQENAAGDMKIYKEKKYDDLNRFRYGVTFRVGYGPFSLIGYYSLASVFDKGNGPNVIPFSAGFAINGL